MFTPGLGAMDNKSNHGLVQAAEEGTLTAQQLLLLLARVAGGEWIFSQHNNCTSL